MNREQFEQEHFCYEGDSPAHLLHCARYSNANGFALAVVASIRFKPNGQLGDWSAYWSGTDMTRREEDAVRWAAMKGNKLHSYDAQHFFPELPIAYYRE